MRLKYFDKILEYSHRDSRGQIILRDNEGNQLPIDTVFSLNPYVVVYDWDVPDEKI